MRSVLVNWICGGRSDTGTEFVSGSRSSIFCPSLTARLRSRHIRSREVESFVSCLNTEREELQFRVSHVAVSLNSHTDIAQCSEPYLPRLHAECRHPRERESLSVRSKPCTGGRCRNPFTAPASATSCYGGGDTCLISPL
jgi:hypothetical protein